MPGAGACKAGAGAGAGGAGAGAESRAFMLAASSMVNSSRGAGSAMCRSLCAGLVLTYK